jgi:hypothetical protein
MVARAQTLADRLASALTPVFGRSPVFVSDSPELVGWMTDQGCPAYRMTMESLAAIPAKSSGAVVMLPTSDPVISYHALERFFRGGRLLVVPLVAFDPSLDAAKYTLEVLARSNFPLAVSENTEWLRVIASCERPIRFFGNGTDLSCELRERVQLMQPRTELALLPGEWDAVGNYFEVAMIPDNDDFFHPGYVVNGELHASGVAIARHRIMPDHLVPLHEQAWSLMHDLMTQGGFPLRVTIENSRITQALAGGRDIALELLRLSNPKLENMLIEVAVSNNPSLQKGELDWGVNTVMNEGVKGIHVAVGDGVTGAHIDLICAGVEVTEW